jgi:nucleotide-binding universal stress UspA family protein
MRQTTQRKEAAMFKTVIWATDGSNAATAALPFARALVEEFGGELVAVHANEVFAGRAGGYPVLADETDLVAGIRAQVDELRLTGIDASFRLITGIGTDAAQTIADIAEEIGADAIVVGTRGRTTIAGLLVGSVTHRLLHIAPCPVLAVPKLKTAAREREPELTATA